MSKFVSRGTSFLATVYALSTPAVVLAGEWVVREDPAGPGRIVTDDETGTIHANGKKATDKVVKVLNDAGSGVVDNGNGPYGHPSAQVLC